MIFQSLLLARATLGVYHMAIWKLCFLIRFRLWVTTGVYTVYIGILDSPNTEESSGKQMDNGMEAKVCRGAS